MPGSGEVPSRAVAALPSLHECGDSFGELSHHGKELELFCKRAQNLHSRNQKSIDKSKRLDMDDLIGHIATAVAKTDENWKDLVARHDKWCSVLFSLIEGTSHIRHIVEDDVRGHVSQTQINEYHRYLNLFTELRGNFSTKIHMAGTAMAQLFEQLEYARKVRDGEYKPKYMTKPVGSARTKINVSVVKTRAKRADINDIVARKKVNPTAFVENTARRQHLINRRAAEAKDESDSPSEEGQADRTVKGSHVEEVKVKSSASPDVGLQEVVSSLKEENKQLASDLRATKTHLETITAALRPYTSAHRHQHGKIGGDPDPAEAAYDVPVNAWSAAKAISLNMNQEDVMLKSSKEIGEEARQEAAEGKYRGYVLANHKHHQFIHDHKQDPYHLYGEGSGSHPHHNHHYQPHQKTHANQPLVPRSGLHNPGYNQVHHHKTLSRVPGSKTEAAIAYSAPDKTRKLRQSLEEKQELRKTALEDPNNELDTCVLCVDRLPTKTEEVMEYRGSVLELPDDYLRGLKEFRDKFTLELSDPKKSAEDYYNIPIKDDYKGPIYHVDQSYGATAEVGNRIAPTVSELMGKTPGVDPPKCEECGYDDPYIRVCVPTTATRPPVISSPARRKDFNPEASVSLTKHMFKGAGTNFALDNIRDSEGYDIRQEIQTNAVEEVDPAALEKDEGMYSMATNQLLERQRSMRYRLQRLEQLRQNKKWYFAAQAGDLHEMNRLLSPKHKKIEPRSHATSALQLAVNSPFPS